MMRKSKSLQNVRMPNLSSLPNFLNKENLQKLQAEKKQSKYAKDVKKIVQEKMEQQFYMKIANLLLNMSQNYSQIESCN
jgi:hypothetical protein